MLVVDKYSGYTMMRGFVSYGAIVRNVDFAYRILRDAFNLLGYTIPNSQASIAASNVDGITLDVVNNRILVSLAVYTDDKISLFREYVIDAPYLVFHQSPGRLSTGLEQSYLLCKYYGHNLYYEFDEQLFMPSNITTVRVGDGIYLRDSADFLRMSGSVGYRITISGANGFVTAAHLPDPRTQRPIAPGAWIYDRNGTHIGRVHSTRLSDIDTAIVTLMPGVTMTNHTGRGTITGRTIGSIVGRTVILDARNGRNREGVIQASFSGFATSSTGTLWINNGRRATYSSWGGDSGGIVYSWQENGVNGMHVGGWTAGTWPDGGNALFIPADNIDFFLNVRPN